MSNSLREKVAVELDLTVQNHREDLQEVEKLLADAAADANQCSPNDYESLEELARILRCAIGYYAEYREMVIEDRVAEIIEQESITDEEVEILREIFEDLGMM